MLCHKLSCFEVEVESVHELCVLRAEFDGGSA